MAKQSSSDEQPSADPSAHMSATSVDPLLNNDIQGGTSNYQEVALIGYGAYGTVYKARSSTSQSFVALKKVRIPLSEDGVPTSLVREISLLRQLENFAHPNVVRLLDICHGKPSQRELTVYLVFEHVEQDLATYLQNCPSPGVGPERIRDIMFQIMRGVDFLHSNRIVHRDLKPQNILIAASGEVKLADFGLARIYEQMQTLTTVVVTLWYRSPEVLLKSSYASPVDIWSCGCIFAELFTRKPLFAGQSESDQLSKILQIIGSPGEDEWPPEVSLSWRTFSSFRATDLQQLIREMESDAACLLHQMLLFDANKRLSANQILDHEYFRDYELYPPVYSSPQNSSAMSHTSGDSSSSSSRAHSSF